MGIDFNLVYRNLKYLHAEYERLNMKWPVNLSRIGDHTLRDIHYHASVVGGVRLEAIWLSPRTSVRSIVNDFSARAL